MKRLIAATLFLFAALVIVTAAEAATNCAPHKDVVAILTERYGETRLGIGIAQTDQLVEIFVGTADGTWTFIVTKPDGTACIFASGTNFEHIYDPPAPQGTPG